MVKNIIFRSDDYEIEGVFNQRTEEKGVIVTHPHPLFGGDMYNMVVETIIHAYHKHGYSTLKFNFRGVGKSQGRYDNGVGEQKDVLAAVSFLAESGIQKIDLAGYSFGAWVGAHAIGTDVPVKNMVMISPPVGFMDFEPSLFLDCLTLVVTGSRDDIAPAARIEKMLSLWNPKARLQVIEGADHFYGGYLERLETALSANL